MSGIFTEQWPLIIWAAVAITFNMFLYTANARRYVMGSFFNKYKHYIELVNWLVLVGTVIYLSYLYTWYFLFSFFIFPVLGLIISSILRGYTQFFYLIGMPIFTIIGIIHLI